MRILLEWDLKSRLFSKTSTIFCCLFLHVLDPVFQQSFGFWILIHFNPLKSHHEPQGQTLILPLQRVRVVQLKTSGAWNLQHLHLASMQCIRKKNWSSLLPLLLFFFFFKWILFSFAVGNTVSVDCRVQPAKIQSPATFSSLIPMSSNKLYS